MKKKIKLRFNIGIINAYTNKDYFHIGKCRHCGKQIYFVNAIGMNKFPATLLDDGTYILHSLVCEVLEKRRKGKELSKAKRKYDKKNKSKSK